MNWALTIVLCLLVFYVLNETVLGKIKEGFAVPLRSDIGLSADGWGEGGGWKRDLRYTEGFVDLQGLGVASDFCRAVYKKSDPETLCVACALGTRDGMDTMEYRTKSKAEGFRFSRDDYWRPSASGRRSDYCRILRDTDTGEYFSSCAVASPTGFKPQEERDTNPPRAIQKLLDAYQGILVWWRWQDDEEDYTGQAVFEVRGKPEFPSMLKPDATRGLQLNRWPLAAQIAGTPRPPITDSLRWGEIGTLRLEQTIQPRQIRAFTFWVFWDSLEKGATILECSNGGKRKDLMRIFLEGGGVDLPSAACSTVAEPACEVRPSQLLAIGNLTQPGRSHSQQAEKPLPLSKSGQYVFEIWDEKQRLMRLASPAGTVIANKWQHVTVTTTEADDWWPTWQLYIDGNLVGEKRDGRMCPAMELDQNFIGQNVRGCLMDLRIYSTPLPNAKIVETMAYAAAKLHPVP